MKAFNKFSEDMDNIYSLVVDSCGCDEIRESLFAWFNADLLGEELDTIKYEYDAKGIFYVLYDLVNYDLVSISNESIEVANSNNSEVAEIIKRYATRYTISQVYNHFIA